MEAKETENQITKSKSKAKPRTDSMRVRKETKKKILGELQALNKKDLGKPITADQYVSLAISLLTPEHLEQLKEESLSKHCAEPGKISMDQLLGHLLGTQKPNV